MGSRARLALVHGPQSSASLGLLCRCFLFVAASDEKNQAKSPSYLPLVCVAAFVSIKTSTCLTMKNIRTRRRCKYIICHIDLSYESISIHGETKTRESPPWAGLPL